MAAPARRILATFRMGVRCDNAWAAIPVDAAQAVVAEGRSTVTNPLPTQSERDAYAPNEFDAFLSAAKGEPYTPAEWEREVNRLEATLRVARIGLTIAHYYGACPAARFEGPLRDEVTTV